MILYEYPLNERVRTLLRLEDLFDRLEFFARREHPLDHHVALGTLFEVLDVAGRADLKSDLLQAFAPGPMSRRTRSTAFSATSTRRWAAWAPPPARVASTCGTTNG